MSIAAHLVDIAAYLDKEVDSDEKRREYGYWGHCTKLVSCTYAIRFDKTGVTSIEALDSPKRVVQWPMSRTRGVLPFPFCDNIGYFTDGKKLSALKEACSRVVNAGGLTEAAEVWCKSVERFREAIESFGGLPKGTKEENRASQNIAFYYGDNAVAVSEMPEVREMMRADNYRFFNCWFDCVPDTRFDTAGRWYDVIDDRELKHSEVCTAHIGFKLDGTPDIKLVTFNKKLNDTADSWGSVACGKGGKKREGKGFNYPMSHEHGRMMDAAMIWLADYSKNVINEETGKEVRRRPFVFSHGGRNYLWFTVLGGEVGGIDSFIEKAEIMPELFTKLLSGERPAGLKTDGEGTPVEYCGVPPEWLSDDGVEVYEITVEGRRATANKDPFSLEALIRAISEYDRENREHGGAASHYRDFRTALAITLSGKSEFKNIGKDDFKNPKFKRLWEDYSQKHILGRRAVSGETMHALRQRLVFDGGFTKASFMRAVLVELAKSSRKSLADIVESRAFALGRWCNKIALAQKHAARPQTFRGQMMRSVYFGKVDVGAELAAYTTPDEINAKKKAADYAKKKEVNEMKYYTPKTRLAFTLHTLAVACSKSDKGEGYPMGAIVNDCKAFADSPMVRTEGDRNAFLLGYMCGLCPEILESLKRQEEVSES